MSVATVLLEGGVPACATVQQDHLEPRLAGARLAGQGSGRDKEQGTTLTNILEL